MRDLVFISYSHKDKDAFEEFRKNLAPAASKGLLSLWTDRDIPNGASWAQDIEKALSRARVALLLVSANFIDSDFIRNEEVHAILAAHERGELSLYWVPISSAIFKIVDLDRWQAAPGCSPDQPLDALPDAQRKQVVTVVCRAILDEMGRLPVLTRVARGDLKQRVNDAIGERYQIESEIGTGSSSIVYKAHSTVHDGPVVVKTLVASELQPGEQTDFQGRVAVAKKLTHPAYIRLYDEFLAADPYCVVTEFVDGCRIDRYREAQGGQVAPRRVKAILRDLAQALAEAHEHNYLHEALLPSNIHVERATHRPRLSAFRFLGIGPSTGMWGTFLINHESCTYLSPEQFHGAARSKETDQYALGLIGHELLSGRPIERVTRPADFVKRPELYASLERSADWTARSPQLAGIILRMLRVEPTQRWTSMAQVAEALDAVTVDDSAADAARRRALASYSAFQASDRVHALYKLFYDQLFELVPDTRPLFSTTDMARQYNALNMALSMLLDHDDASPRSAEAFARVVARHRQLGLAERHFAAFERAFLSALEAAGEPAEALAAWRTVLAPGLARMRAAIGT